MRKPVRREKEDKKELDREFFFSFFFLIYKIYKHTRQANLFYCTQYSANNKLHVLDSERIGNVVVKIDDGQQTFCKRFDFILKTKRV